MGLLKKIGIAHPIVQAPMAGVSTPAMAAAVSNAGGLGSIGVGAAGAKGARQMIADLQAATDKPFNVNLFVHAAPRMDAARETAWLDRLSPEFAPFDVPPPGELNTIYASFENDPDMLTLLVETRPAVVSFHFGLPDAAKIAALKAAGCVLLATATNIEEAKLIEAAGVDGVIAQGIEAGGHRGVFDPAAPDTALGTLALTRILVKQTALPVIAAGGLMDGQGIVAALHLGAEAAQLGTAFIACPESSADAAYRAALRSERAHQTMMTNAISGRPARCLANRFTAWAQANAPLDPPDYPRAYDAGKALNAAAKAAGSHGYGAQWAGQGAPLARDMPAAELVETLMKELADANRRAL
jgi:nitronate monooxygenase